MAGAVPGTCSHTSLRANTRPPSCVRTMLYNTAAVQRLRTHTLQRRTEEEEEDEEEDEEKEEEEEEEEEEEKGREEE